MKVFWSWQSDTPGKIGRHLVRDALKEAIERLKVAPEIEEPSARESRDALHLDHDRAGVPGSPDLARTILDKIDKATVFVGDVTPVGKAESGKKLINPNVAIELGYALHSLTDSSLLMVMNEHYGAREDLPFDLRHKAGPILFNLSPDADRKKIEETRSRLAADFATALRPYLTQQATVTQQATGKPHAADAVSETPHTLSPAIFFERGEGLAHVGEPGIDEITFTMPHESVLYLRLVPTKRLDEPLRLARLQEAVDSTPFIQPLQPAFTQSFRQLNSYGSIVAEPHRKSSLKALTQIFRNGEIWGINAYLMSRPTELGQPLLPSQAIEQTLIVSLHAYVKFADVRLGIAPPYAIEAGVTGIKGGYLAMSNDRWGPIRTTAFSHRRILNERSESACEALLLDFFERLYDLTGYARPKHLYGFPKP